MTCELTEQIRILKEETRGLRAIIAGLKTCLKTQGKERDALRVQRDKMIPLCSYSDHKLHCSVRVDLSPDCDCGFQSVLDGEDESHANLCAMKAHVDGTPPEPLLTSEEVDALRKGTP